MHKTAVSHRLEHCGSFCTYFMLKCHIIFSCKLHTCKHLSLALHWCIFYDASSSMWTKGVWKYFLICLAMPVHSTHTQSSMLVFGLLQKWCLFLWLLDRSQCYMITICQQMTGKRKPANQEFCFIFPVLLASVKFHFWFGFAVQSTWRDLFTCVCKTYTKRLFTWAAAWAAHTAFFNKWLTGWNRFSSLHENDQHTILSGIWFRLEI